MENKDKDKIIRRGKAFLDECDKYILEKLIQGYSPAMVEQDLIDNFEFNGKDNARKAIARVNRKIADTNKDEFEIKVGKYLEMYNNLYKNAVEAGEWKTANAILDSMTKLNGLLTTKIEAKIESDNNINVTNVSDEKLEELVNKLIENNKE